MEQRSTIITQVITLEAVDSTNSGARQLQPSMDVDCASLQDRVWKHLVTFARHLLTKSQSQPSASCDLKFEITTELRNDYTNIHYSKR